VTSVGPLRILIDGDTVAVPFTPESLIDPATLLVDDVVHANQSGHRLVVLGRSGGTQGVPFAMAAGAVSAATIPAYANVRVTVTLPVGRFSVAPMVTVSLRGDDIRSLSVSSLSETASSFIVQRSSQSSTDKASIGARWTATQMSSGSAAG